MATDCTPSQDEQAAKIPNLPDAQLPDVSFDQPALDEVILLNCGMIVFHANNDSGVVAVN